MSRHPFCLVMAALLLLAGCGRSAPTRYYVLESGRSAATADNLPARTLRVAQVSVPDYLNRTGMVSRAPGSTELEISQFHLWGEPVADGVRRLMHEGLSGPLLAQGVTVAAPGDDSRADYALLVDVQRLDGAFNAEAALEARWTLRRGEDILRRGAYADTEPVEGTSYKALAAAESRMARRMADHLARILSAMLARGGR